MPKVKDLVVENVKFGTIEVPRLPILKGTSIQFEVKLEELNRSKK